MGAPYLDSEMWAFAPRANRFPPPAPLLFRRSPPPTSAKPRGGWPSSNPQKTWVPHISILRCGHSRHARTVFLPGPRSCSGDPRRQHRQSRGAGGPALTHKKTWVPHLRDGLIVVNRGPASLLVGRASVGFRVKREPSYLHRDTSRKHLSLTTPQPT
jgi:hypothetical protein